MLATPSPVPTVLACFAQSPTPGKGQSLWITRFVLLRPQTDNPDSSLCGGRSEEQCLVRSGLVQLMDSLCSLSGQRECSSNEKQTKKQKVATMAWAAFQVLANRCIEWEKVEGMSQMM